LLLSALLWPHAAMTLLLGTLRLMEESIRMTEDRDKWNGETTPIVWPTLRSRMAKEQYRTQWQSTVLGVSGPSKSTGRPYAAKADHSICRL